MEKGTVKWFNAAKGYGFIQRSSGKDVFVHNKSFDMDGFRTLKDGNTVEFDIEQVPKGFLGCQSKMSIISISTSSPFYNGVVVWG
jgi:CspA family cold shock protein